MAGLSSYGYVRDFALKNEFQISNTVIYNKIGRSHPKLVELTHSSGFKTTLIFITHPSKYFSYNAWGDFLLINFPDLV